MTDESKGFILDPMGDLPIPPKLEAGRSTDYVELSGPWNRAVLGKLGTGMSFPIEDILRNYRNYVKAHPDAVQEIVIDAGHSFVFDPVAAAEDHVRQHPEDADSQKGICLTKRLLFGMRGSEAGYSGVV